MAKYLTEEGRVCTPDDPKRALWYGWCTYWTDDWDELRSKHPVKMSAIVGGTPSCPTCGAFGFQTTAADWFAGAERFEREGNARYQEFLAYSKETCHGKRNFIAWYREWLSEGTADG